MEAEFCVLPKRPKWVSSAERKRYENSPATLVLGSGRDLSSSPSNGRLRLKVLADSSLIFSRRLRGLLRFSTEPSDKSLGFLARSASRTRDIFVFGQAEF